MTAEIPSTNILFTDPAISSPPISIVMIHPLVVYSIADYYERRGTDEYAIGILLGEHVDRKAIVYDCYPCKPDPKTVAREDLNKTIFNERKQLYQNEIILGYYTFCKRKIDWPAAIREGCSAVHLWMRPISETSLKIDVFSVLKSKVNNQEQLIASPIVYMIEASFEEQAALSRLAATSCSGSLQAAINELLELIRIMERVCLQTTGRHARENEIGRQIYVALAKTQLKAADRITLEKTKADIQTFLDVLHSADGLALMAEKELSKPFDKA
ncbi:Mov34/MPN/PAD-1 family protein [Tritrichomonas foetus]|uniref:Mov34/MPN/PAD-1 family protein n=1 Tax=Tritrichomonas foetus TaxID=1144522 RepID=A0A1J4KMA2_9EUKA|nr:Mov34/MPN/PAD-1 family protein [Tritrichomonas foetus]|eukprot:OHT12064.1 Mov34/MPN/PAD-1 family protein [Tritrichomonas foetus]